MGGFNSGTTRKRRTLPKTFQEGQLDRVDRRAKAVRAVLEGAEQIIEDRGGEELASHLMRRAAHRVMHLDQVLAQDELRLVQGQSIDRPQYIAAAQTWLRYAQAIGLDRKARRVQSLADVLAQQSSPPPADSVRQSAASPAATPAVSAGGGDLE